MEYIHRMVINFIIHDFKQIATALKAKADIFVFQLYAGQGAG
jgi:hypothetical protein